MSPALARSSPPPASPWRTRLCESRRTKPVRWERTAIVRRYPCTAWRNRWRGRHRARSRRYRSRMDLSLFFAGTGGSVPGARRGLPAILVRLGGDRLLFDCGEGTQRQLLRSIGLVDLECVFITPLPRRPLARAAGDAQVVRAARPRAAADRLRPARPHRAEGPHARDLRPPALRARASSSSSPPRRVERDGYLVAAVPVSHGARSAFGYAIVEDARPGQLDARLAEQLGVTPGPDFGRLQRGETVDGVAPEQVMGAAARGAQDRPLRRHRAV